MDRIELDRTSFESKGREIAEALDSSHRWADIFTVGVTAGVVVAAGCGLAMRMGLVGARPALLGRAFQVMGVSLVVLGVGYAWQRRARLKVEELSEKLADELAEFDEFERGEKAKALFEAHGAKLGLVLKYADRPEMDLEAIARERASCRLLKERCKRVTVGALVTAAVAGAGVVAGFATKRLVKVALPLGMTVCFGGMVTAMGTRLVTEQARDDARRLAESLDRGLMLLGDHELEQILPRVGGQVRILRVDGDLRSCPNLKGLVINDVPMADLREQRLRKLKVTNQDMQMTWERLPATLESLKTAGLREKGEVSHLLKLERLEAGLVTTDGWEGIQGLTGLRWLKIERMRLAERQELLNLPGKLERLKIPNLPPASDEHPLRGHEYLEEVTFTQPDRASFEAVPKMRRLRRLRLKQNTGLDETSLDWILSARHLDQVRIDEGMSPGVTAEALIRLCAQEHYVVLIDGEKSKYLLNDDLREGKAHRAKSVVLKRTGV